MAQTRSGGLCFRCQGTILYLRPSVGRFVIISFECVPGTRGCACHQSTPQTPCVLRVFATIFDCNLDGLGAMKLKHFESALQPVTKYSDLGTDHVNIDLEQYSTSPHLAARMVYTAEFEYGDIDGRAVLDLGCGTGMLGIAAGILGAGTVVGLDVDEGALAAAAENASDMDIDMDLVCCDVSRVPCVPGRFDTVLMNPPFGTRRAGIDIIFLEAALEAASTVYSMHKTSTRKHLLKKADEWGVDAVVLAQLRFDIPATYKFHKRNSKDIEVDLIRFQKRLPSTDPDGDAIGKG